MIAESPLDWKRRVCYGGCVFHDDQLDCGRPLQAHHVLSWQKLRGIHREDLRWDVRNGICLCYAAHRRHDLAVERIPWDRLPAAAIEFADELGLRWWLEKRYPETRVSE